MRPFLLLTKYKSYRAFSNKSLWFACLRFLNNNNKICRVYKIVFTNNLRLMIKIYFRLVLTPTVSKLCAFFFHYFFFVACDIFLDFNKLTFRTQLVTYIKCNNLKMLLFNVR